MEKTTEAAAQKLQSTQKEVMFEFSRSDLFPVTFN